MYKVPSVLGLTEEDARKNILADDPDAKIYTYEDYSDEYEEGQVMKQYPEPDSEREKASEVFLTISTGPKPFEIPNVYGLEEDRADKKLQDDLGLKVTHEYVPDDKVASGLVIKTDPIRQTLVVKGDAVTVYVSTGPENKQVVVPDLIGSTQDEAEQMLKDVGLSLGSVSYADSETYDKGLVTYQSNTSGQKADKGSTVDIIISNGPAATDTNGDTTAKYMGSVTIDVNPFDYIGSGEARIEIDMEQGGWSLNLKDQTMNASDFPLTIDGIDGEDTSEAVVTMKVDGDYFMMPGETEPHKWYVEFKPVEE
jgi:serine/threonine-protein kinase